MKSALVRKRNSPNPNPDDEEKIVSSSNFDDLNRRLSILSLSDNGSELPNSNESPSDLDNEQKEPEDRGRKNSLFDSENCVKQPPKTESSPSVLNDPYKGGGGKDEDQSEEESDLGSSSGNHSTYRETNLVIEKNQKKPFLSKKFSIDMDKNQFFEYYKNVSSSETESKSSLPSYKSQNNPDSNSANNKHIDPKIRDLRKLSIVSATPNNSETDQSLSDIEAMRKLSVSNYSNSKLNKSTLNDDRTKQTEKKEAKEYNLKIIKSHANFTYSMDHPDGTEFKDIHVISKKDGGIDISVSISGGEADLSQ